VSANAGCVYCTVSTCGFMRVPPNAGAVSACKWNALPSTTCEMKCLPGYNQVGGNAVRTCQLNGQWSGSPIQCASRNLSSFVNHNLFV
jgi:hypothetical protein